MPTDNRKRAIRDRQAATGEPYTEAARHIDHPAPDLTVLADLPYAAGRPVNLVLAAATVAGCRAGCASCQRLLIPRLVADRPTVAVLAGAVYGMLPAAGLLASSVTRAWQPLAQTARSGGDGAAAALAALERMSATDVAELLEDALDHWAAGGADVVPVLLDLPDEPGAEAEPLVSYALCPGTVESTGGPLPIVVLVPETSAAGADDLRTRCASYGWQPWDLTALPAADPAWRLRAHIGSRSIEEIAHVDAEGWDDVTLWQAPDPAPLPGDWWNLLDRAQHVLLCGPAADGGQAALQDAARTGELLAVIARVSFL